MRIISARRATKRERKIYEEVKDGEVRKEYKREDLGKGIRGKYFEDYKKGTNLVLLSPDVAAAFPDGASVNEVLRSLMKIARQATGLTRHCT